jgi:hypothetical protein
MKIEFETGNLTEQEASGLVALLQALHGSTVIPASYERVGEVVRVTGSAARQCGPDTRSNLEITRASAKEVARESAGTDPVDGEIREPLAELRSTANTDADGLPWDERIHASTRSMKADGTWTRRRGISDETYDAVMAELRASVAAGTDVGEAQELPVIQEPTPEPDSAAQAFAPAVPTPPVPPVPVPAVPAPPTASAAPEFHELIRRVTPLQAAGKLDAAGVSSLLGAVGLKSIADLIKADDQTRQAFAAMLDTVQ